MSNIKVDVDIKALFGTNSRIKQSQQPSSMTILGIGVDLVHIPRITSLLRRRNPEKFAAKILSAQEYNQWVSLGSSEPSIRLRFLAVRYCRSINSIY
jgi:hypothetical protein